MKSARLVLLGGMYAAAMLAVAPSAQAPETKPTVIKAKPMKTNKTNILRGALSSIVAFTILASAAASQAATP